MYERMSVSEAAKALSVSPQAIRNRIKRESIQHGKDEETGQTYVYIDLEQEGNTGDNGRDNGVDNPYIEALKSQIEELKRDKEQLREEARRKDHLLAAALERIPAIEAPAADSIDATEPRESAVPASETEGKGQVPEDPADGQMKRSWLRRFFGL